MEYADEKELDAAVEGILFASGEPVQVDRICFALSLERADAEKILCRLQDYYAYERRGIRLLRMEDRWQLCSSPDHADVIRKAFEIRKPAKLSQPALEALTIIAYYQPTTRAYVDKLRGVDSAYTVGLLLERGLIETCGTLQAPGRPLLYRTTEKFLRSFHISSLDELPPLNEDDAPPQQLKIEDIEPAPGTSAETAAPQEISADADTPQEASADADTSQETSTDKETPQEISADAEMLSEAYTDEETPPEPFTDAGTLPETEGTPSEMPVPVRELMARRRVPTLTAHVKNVPKRHQRDKKRQPPRLAGTFRPRRRRHARKRRGVKTPSHPKSAEHPGTVPEPGAELPVNGAHVRRKFSGKAVRRCLHCLLCGCWLSWFFF